MRIKKLALLILLVLVGVSSSNFLLNYGRSEKSNQREFISLSEENLNEFVSSGWNFELGANMEGFLKKYGDPTALNKTSIKNKYHKSNDIKYSVKYPGLNIEFLQLSSQAGSNLFPIKIEIINNDWPIKNGIQIGDAYEKVVSILGNQQVTKTPNSLTYYNESDVVKLSFNKAKLENISWYLYMD